MPSVVRQFVHACGHAGEVTAYRRLRIDAHGFADWLVARAEQQPCADCAAKAALTVQQRTRDDALRAAAADGLPPLVGTAKQVAWAETLRYLGLATLDVVCQGLMARAAALVEQGRLPVAALGAVTTALDTERRRWREETAARVWIDGRVHLVTDYPARAYTLSETDRADINRFAQHAHDAPTLPISRLVLAAEAAVRPLLAVEPPIR